MKPLRPRNGNQYLHREGIEPRRVDAATRVAILARMFDWRKALVAVQSANMVRWHALGKGFSSDSSQER